MHHRPIIHSSRTQPSDVPRRLPRLLPQVAESGAGGCDVTSLRGEGAMLSGMFNPASTPRPVAETERVLARLALPFTTHAPREESDDEEAAAGGASLDGGGAHAAPRALPSDNKALDTAEHVAATLKAAAAGILPAARFGVAVPTRHGASLVAAVLPPGAPSMRPVVGATSAAAPSAAVSDVSSSIRAILPPPEVLRAIRPLHVRGPRRTSNPLDDDGDDDKEEKLARFGDAAAMPLPKGGRRAVVKSRRVAVKGKRA